LFKQSLLGKLLHFSSIRSGLFPQSLDADSQGNQLNTAGLPQKLVLKWCVGNPVLLVECG